MRVRDRKPAGIGRPFSGIPLQPNPGTRFFLKYSDLNGYSHALPVHLLYKPYWIAFGLALGGIALLFWQRGVALSFRERLRIAKSRLSGKMAFALTAVFAGVVWFGGLLFQAENNPANTHLTAAQEQEHLERFQRDFGKYRETVQPRIVSVFFNLNLFPESWPDNTTGIPCSPDTVYFQSQGQRPDGQTVWHHRPVAGLPGHAAGRRGAVGLRGIQGQKLVGQGDAGVACLWSMAYIRHKCQKIVPAFGCPARMPVI